MSSSLGVIDPSMNTLVAILTSIASETSIETPVFSTNPIFVMSSSSLSPMNTAPPSLICTTLDQCLPYYIAIPVGCLLVAVVAIVLMIILFALCCRKKKGRVKDQSEDVQPFVIEDPDSAIPQSLSLKLKEQHPKPQVISSISSLLPQYPHIPLEDLESYIEDLEENDGYSQEYALLDKTSPKHPVTIAWTKENAIKNRYRNISPFDHSRVILSTPPEEPSADYINANFINGYSKPDEYIAAQGPLERTILDFWRMIWETNAHIIVMVTNLFEIGKLKCSMYWPEAGSIKMGSLVIQLEKQDKFPTYVKRYFTLSHSETNETHHVIQYHYTKWPDFGAPHQPNDMLHFIKVVRSQVKQEHGPIVTHCSAGVGRTGTFIAVDILIQHIRDHPHLNVCEVLCKMRNKRMKMVQSTEQYRFIYRALLEAYLLGNTLVPQKDVGMYFNWLMEEDGAELEKEFLNLKKARNPAHDEYSSALNSSNITKNRDHHRLPLEHNRICLGEYGEKYINASPIMNWSREIQYIITQHPMEHTQYDFWLMVLQNRCSAIIMIGGLDYSNPQNIYWPRDDALTIKEISVTLESELVGNLCRRIEFTVAAPKLEYQPQSVVLHHFSEWNMRSLLSIVDRWLEFCTTLQEEKSSPFILHTTPMVGTDDPCGVFCAILSCFQQLRSEEWVDVFQTVRDIQNQRPSALTNLEHYKFIYQSIVRWLQSRDF